MFSVFFYYITYASIVLVYGIGMERAVFLSGNKNPLWLKAIKMLITASSVSALSYLFVNSLLVPAELAELYPFAVEFSISLLFIFVAITESSSLAECVFITCICVLSFFIFIPFVYSLCRKFDLYGGRTECSRNNFILASIAIIMLILLCWNVSWLNKGVFQ